MESTTTLKLLVALLIVCVGAWHHTSMLARAQPRWLHAVAKMCGLPAGASAVDGVYFNVAVYDGNDVVSKSLKKTGLWEPKLWTWLKPYCDAECTFVDVGANIGAISMLVATTGRQVVAYEPFPANRALFKTTMCMNADAGAKVTLKPYGLSKTAAACALLSPAENFGDVHVDCPGAKAYSMQDDAMVKMGTAHFKTLDSETWLFNRSKVMKIDVEGHELKVLQGGSAFFTASAAPLAVVMEYNLFSESNQKILWQTMIRYGYKESGKDNYNVLFVKREL